MTVKATKEKFAEITDFSQTPLGIRHTICNFVRDGEDGQAPFIDMVRYGKLLEVLPDHIVENLEKGRLAHDGAYPMLKNGLGYQEMLSAIIVDGSAIGTSAAEARLAPALVIPKNYMAPGGIPGRTLRARAMGRVTTLNTAATFTYRFRIAATDIITGTTIAASGGITQDAAVHTNEMWELNCDITSRVVGSAGTVFGVGRAEMSSQALTVAARSAGFMGSAGSTAPAAATWDTTIDEYLEFTGQWSLATAYSIQAHEYILEALN